MLVLSSWRLPGVIRELDRVQFLFKVVDTLVRLLSDGLKCR